MSVLMSLSGIGPERGLEGEAPATFGGGPDFANIAVPAGIFAFMTSKGINRIMMAARPRFMALGFLRPKMATNKPPPIRNIPI